MSENKESLKKIMMAGFCAEPEAPLEDGRPAGQVLEEIMALAELLPADALIDLRGRLNGMIAAMNGTAPEEAVESIKDACLNPPARPAGV